MTTQQHERDKADLHEREKLEARIGAAVIHALGRPEDLRALHVRRLWGEFYRVNVLTGDDPASAAIAHSFFLTTDGAGDVLAASPVILKQY